MKPPLKFTTLLERNSVTITTFHAAKGLEWPVVYIAGLEEGFSPISHAVSESSLDEERRLLYVAMARAQDQLHCSWESGKEHLGLKKKISRRASPYLKEISRSHGRRQRPNHERSSASRADSDTPQPDFS